MTVGVYGIFCSETGECLYIGQSKDVEGRYSQHINRLKNGYHRRKDFIEWFKTHLENPESLIYTIIEETSDDDFEKNKVEIFWFKELNPKFFGKKPSLNDRWQQSETTRKKIGISLKKTHASKHSSFLRIVECKNCSNQIEQTWATRNRKFCTRKCYYENVKTKENPISVRVPRTVSLYERTCGTCKKFYKRDKRDKNKVFCSRKCQIASYEKTSVLTPEIVHELYHVQKLSLRAIAPRFNMSHVALTLYMDANNIPKRDKNDRHKHF